MLTELQELKLQKLKLQKDLYRSKQTLNIVSVLFYSLCAFICVSVGDLFSYVLSGILCFFILLRIIGIYSYWKYKQKLMI